MKPKPPTHKVLKLRDKLAALALYGVNGEKVNAQAKLDRLCKRYDFSQKVQHAEDIFKGVFYKSSVATPILAFRPDDSDIAGAIKWAIEHETGVLCCWRDGVLLAAAAPVSAKRLEEISKLVSGSFLALWQKYQNAGANAADRGNFILGLYEGMMNEHRQGQALPNRATPKRKATTKRKAIVHAPGLNLHPYSVALNLGKSIRFSVPIETISGELEQTIKGAIA